RYTLHACTNPVHCRYYASLQFLYIAHAPHLFFCLLRRTIIRKADLTLFTRIGQRTRFRFTLPNAI
ncbi:MAG: hypothetical protein AB3N11_08075, partial [Arenibacterium sp.]